MAVTLPLSCDSRREICALSSILKLQHMAIVTVSRVSLGGSKVVKEVGVVAAQELEVWAIGQLAVTEQPHRPICREELVRGNARVAKEHSAPDTTRRAQEVGGPLVQDRNSS